MKDFFISYNVKDKRWAEWIAWTLEEAKYSVVIQAWDFRPGANFVLEMHQAVEGAERTIAVLSDNYLRAKYTQPEWAAAFAKDPQGRDRKLIPVRVAECQPTGLLGSCVYVDLVGLPEADARSALLGAFSPRVNPAERPQFPGEAETRPKRTMPKRKEYPGTKREKSVSDTIGFGDRVLARVVRKAMSPEERVTLAKRLNSMLPQYFNILVFALAPPPGLVPAMPASQADRSYALLTWAEADGGCGLETVKSLLEEIINPR